MVRLFNPTDEGLLGPSFQGLGHHKVVAGDFVLPNVIDTRRGDDDGENRNRNRQVTQVQVPPKRDPYYHDRRFS